MKIVKCKKCGNTIHQASRCYHCGNSSLDVLGEKSVVHPNVQDEFKRIHLMLDDKKFDEVIHFSEKLLEWMPRCAEIYWIRLLASHKCATDMELIYTGVTCTSDANYCNAVRYATPEQRKVYTDVQIKIERIQQGLQKALEKYIHERKISTRVQSMPAEIKTYLEGSQKRLFKLWADLEETEQKLFILEMDCSFIANEYKDALQNALESATAIKSKTYTSTECSEKELHSYQVRLAAILKQSEQARESLANLRSEHPYVSEFSDLVKLREQQIAAISAELNALKKYESDIQNVVSAFERIEENSLTVSRQIENAQFQEVRTFLDQAIFDKVLSEAGIVR